MFYSQAPAVSLDHTLEIKFNIGYEPFRYNPPAGFESLAKLARRKMEDKIVEQAGTSCGKVIATSGDSGIVIEDLTMRARSGFPSAVGAGILLTHGKWYYEINLESSYLAQHGWADLDFIGDSGMGKGTGDDKHSWGWDGYRVLMWADGRFKWGKKWDDGDVVGCAVDLDNRTMSFSLNGNWDQGAEPGATGVMGEVEALRGFQYTAGLTPSFTYQSAGATANWGQFGLRYKAPDEEYHSVWSWLVDHKPSLAGTGVAATKPGATSSAPRTVLNTRPSRVALRVESGFSHCMVSGYQVSNAMRLVTVAADKVELAAGSWYFEAKVDLGGKGSRVVVGLIDPQFRGDWSAGTGVGDDEHSWGVHLQPGQPVAARHRGCDGDILTARPAPASCVVGCYVDVDAGTVAFSLDGVWLVETTPADEDATPRSDAGGEGATPPAAPPTAAAVPAAKVPAAEAPPVFSRIDFDRALVPAVAVLGVRCKCTLNFGDEGAAFTHAPGAGAGLVRDAHPTRA